MIKWINSSISHKTGFAFFCLFAVTYLSTAFVVYVGAKQSIIKSETESISQYANLKLDQIQNEIEQRAANLNAWASLEVMNDLIAGDVDKRITRTLQGLHDKYNFGTAMIAAFNAQYRLTASSSGDSLATFEMPKEWLPINNQLKIVEHQTILPRMPMLVFVIPIKASFSQDLTIGYLAILFPWEKLEKLIIDKDFKSILFKQTDRHPILVSDLNSAADLDFLDQQNKSISINNERYIFGSSSNSIPILPDWKIALFKSEKTAFSSLEKVAYQLFGLGLILTVPMLFGIRWLTKTLTDPLHDLSEFIKELSSNGDLSKRITISSSDELGDLSKSFNKLTESLAKTTADRERFVKELEELNITLENRVKIRTLAIETANEELRSAMQILKETQSQLVHSEKMASLGQLVAGVAHELNNPVGFIYANFPQMEEYANDLLALIDELLKLPMDESSHKIAEQKIAEVDLKFVSESIMETIRSGKAGALRVKEIVNSLRSFSRMDESEPKRVLIEEGINETLAILNHKIKGRINVVKDYQLNRQVTCLPGQINQVVMNIINNAIQATADNGTITISTRVEDEWAVISIEDTGQGIPDNIIGKIFDPFFTTKDVGEGTGLGLSISHGIIEKHGGRIEVSSKVGIGTRFIIKLKINAQLN